ncbi:MAG: N-acetylmuramoyl-L-alanine amidase family protein [Oscillospiraceae bacterium]
MEIRKVLFTHNPRYKEARIMTPRGIMVHSTGANNPNLRRYVQPDDGYLGVNTNGNDWNRESQPLCVHAFIGLDKAGEVRCYQVLPWNYRTYHCGTGPKGSANSTHIAFEICEDGLNNGDYFEKIYNAAAELCTYLCELYGLSAEDIICHSEGHELGIASGHTDVMHWFPRFGRTMDDLRGEVKRRLGGEKAGEEEMTQEQFDLMMEKYLEKLGEKEPSEWSERARQWAESRGIINGDDNENKKYKKFSTREELAQMLFNAFEGK